MKATAQLVVEATVGHFLQGQLSHVEGIEIASAFILGQQEVEGHRLRELGVIAKAAILFVKILLQRHHRVIKQVRANFPILGGKSSRILQCTGEASGLS